MSRTPQPEGGKGSLKWMQRAVDEAWSSLDMPILEAFEAGQTIDWRSPIKSDDYAEYRDGHFLKLLELGDLKQALAEFWPARGPQWDALGITSSGTRLLVEAKAHVAEMCSPGSAASPTSLTLIRQRLDETAIKLGAKADHAPWDQTFYQIANRLAHLHWLIERGVDARLVLVNFLNDAEMDGPHTVREWQAAYQVAYHAMGLGRRHNLKRYIIEVYPDVAGR